MLEPEPTPISNSQVLGMTYIYRYEWPQTFGNGKEIDVSQNLNLLLRAAPNL